MGGSQIWLEQGEQMTVDDLMKAVSIVSANDASVALAEHVAGSEENFVRLMNKRAKALGLKDTVYVNCTGLTPDDPGQQGQQDVGPRSGSSGPGGAPAPEPPAVDGHLDRLPPERPVFPPQHQ